MDLLVLFSFLLIKNCHSTVLNSGFDGKAGFKECQGTEPPGKVRRTSVVVQETIASVIWSPPLQNQECIKHYEVSVDTQTQTVYETLAIFAQLQPCGQYIAKIVTVDLLDRRSDVEERYFEMLKSKPTPVQNCMVNATSNERSSWAEVSWMQPLFGARCTARYRITIWVQNENRTEEPQIMWTTETRTVISKLKACEVYQVEVTPEVDLGEDGDPNTVPMEVPKRISIPPRWTTLVNHTGTTLTISSQNEDQDNVCHLLCAKFRCIYDGSLENAQNPGVTEKVYKTVLINNKMERFNATLKGLVPSSMYKCSASLKNIAGWSDFGLDIGRHPTESAVPSEPDSVKASNITNSSLILTWEPPLEPNGSKVYLYYIHITLIGPKYKVPTLGNCSEIIEYNRTVHTEVPNREFELLALNPYSKYVIGVCASNNAGLGPFSPPLLVETLPASSEQVTSLEYDLDGPLLSTTIYNVTTIFRWRRPCRCNGELIGFKLDFDGSNGVNHTHWFSVNVTVVDDDDPDKLYEVVEHSLKPNFNYTVACYAIIDNDPNHNSEKKVLNFETPAAIPNTDEVATVWGDLDSFKSPKPTENVVVIISDNVFKSIAGEIKYLAILLSQAGCQSDPERQIGLTKNENWPKVNSWDGTSKEECISQYQTTPIGWDPRQARKPQTHITFTVGVEACPSKNVYCNGPLRPGTTYNVVLRVFSQSGYSDTDLLRFRTDDLVAIMTVILSICAFQIGFFVIGLFILFRSFKVFGPYKFAWSTTDEPLDVLKKNFPSYYAELCANDNEKLIVEFKKINLTTMDLINLTKNTAAKLNEAKNRYTDIYPFDSNRVLLDTSDGDSDYINGSYINGYKHSKEYIATQGPKPETTYDFWRMIVQCEVEAIVMLTQLKECDMIKCCEYFPKVNKEQHYEDISVKCTQETNFKNHKKRIFVVHKNNEIRTVIHYRFTRWPDHDCPRNPYDLIKFIKIVRNEHKSSTAPIVVHCSAGVGRTGTFIAVDILMQRFKHEKKLNVYETVKQLRMQRVRMVQNAAQYGFIYRCVLELIRKERNWRGYSKDASKCKANGGHVVKENLETSMPDIECSI